MIPIPYIEYLNVRIRGYRSRLFTRDTYEDLLVADNLGAMTTFLLDQPTYHEDIELALEGLSEREGLERGVSTHFGRCITSILDMTDGKARHLFEAVLYSFDLRNLRTIVLAHKKGIPFREARYLLVPCCSLNMDELSAMLSAPDLEEVIHFLSNRYPLGAAALRKALKGISEKEPSVTLINRLELNIYRYILKHLTRTDSDTKILRDVYRSEIDMKNITSALKYVWEGIQPDRDNADIFIPGGTINTRFLDEISRAESLDEAFEMVDSTPFRPAVEKGIIYFAETGYFHEMERFFEEVFIQRTQFYRRFNPFGIGIFLGYIWGQFVELTNLRAIINGIAFRTGVAQIRKSLIYV